MPNQQNDHDEKQNDMVDDDHHHTSTLNLEDRPDDLGWRRTLYIIIFEAETKYGKIFDVALLWAILLSVVVVVLESDKGLYQNYGSIFLAIEWALTVFFTIEYGLRLIITKRPIKYAKSFFGIVDLLSILPAYIDLLFPGAHYLMVFRVMRLLRVFRILKLVRFVKAARVLADALYASRFKIYIFLGVIMSLVLIMGTCMYIVEGEQVGFSSIPKSMYWTIVTMTTVGYGDIVPLTNLGKFVASIMMILGYAIIAVPTGIVSSELAVANKENSDTKCKRCMTPINDESNYCNICGEKQ